MEGFDDLPETHLEDDEYEAFLDREFGSDGTPRGGPAVGVVILVIVLVVLAIAVVVFR